jgi:hypothetical protein
LAPAEIGTGLAWPSAVQYPYETGPKCARPLSEETLTVSGLRVREDAIEKAERIIGRSPIHEEGDAGDFVAWRCWEAANGDGTVLYVARHEIGAEIRVLGAEMAFAGRGACPKSKLVHRRMATGNGLRLGLDRARVEKVAGRASWVGREGFERACWSRRPMTKAEKAATNASGGDAFWDIYSAFRGVESSGELVALGVTWSATN